MNFSKILILDIDRSFFDQENFNRLNRLSEQIVFAESASVSKNSLEGVDVILGDYYTKIDQQLINQTPNLKYVGVSSVSVEEIDLNYASSKGIVVANNAGYCADAIAEFVLASVLSRIRQLGTARNAVKNGDFSLDYYRGWELKNKVLGILGLGGIGTRMAEIGLGLGMEVKYYSRTRKTEQEEIGVEFCELNNLLSQSDIFCIFLPYDDATNGILDIEQISLIKQNAVVVNVCHTEIFNFAVLLEKLKNNSFGYIQTYFNTIPDEHRDALLALPAVELYPTIAIATEETRKKRQDLMISCLESFREGTIRNQVN